MPRGGKREGAGRPKGQGKFKEPTKPIRVPVTMVQDIFHFIENQAYKLPFYSCTVSAGFPSPAEDFTETSLDLNEKYITNPAASFCVRVSGDSMKEANIHSGDLLVVDRSIKPQSGKVVIAAVDGQLTVKRLMINEKKSYLMPENKEHTPIEIKEGNDVHIWGVVKAVIHDV